MTFFRYEVLETTRLASAWATGGRLCGGRLLVGNKSFSVEAGVRAALSNPPTQAGASVWGPRCAKRYGERLSVSWRLRQTPSQVFKISFLHVFNPLPLSTPGWPQRPSRWDRGNGRTPPGPCPGSSRSREGRGAVPMRGSTARRTYGVS